VVLVFSGDSRRDKSQTDKVNPALRREGREQAAYIRTFDRDATYAM